MLSCPLQRAGMMGVLAQCASLQERPAAPGHSQADGSIGSVLGRRWELCPLVPAQPPTQPEARSPPPWAPETPEHPSPGTSHLPPCASHHLLQRRTGGHAVLSVPRIGAFSLWPWLACEWDWMRAAEEHQVWGTGCCQVACFVLENKSRKGENTEWSCVLRLTGQQSALTHQCHDSHAGVGAKAWTRQGPTQGTLKVPFMLSLN